jgi:3-methyladenine DNA glycosylase AlkD
MTLTAPAVRRRLHARAVPGNVAILQRFFKTGPGEYGAGDRFIGVNVPGIRAVCRECRGVANAVVLQLLRSKVHEERLLALLMLVDRFEHGAGPADANIEESRRRVYETYLANTAFINNWDLVDASAPQIVGRWLQSRSRAPLVRLARSASLWERRIAIVATFAFIRAREFGDTFRIADLLLNDEHDLIHKATGWMLREVGKRDGAALRAYLSRRYRRMPRTALRYAIERFPGAERQAYLTGRVRPADTTSATPERRAVPSAPRSTRPRR